MSDRFSFAHRIDAERHRLYLTAVGKMDSRGFVDGQIDALKATGEPWLYDKLIDLRQCEGHVTYADIDRLAAYWTSVAFKAPRPVKAAVISRNDYVVARLPLADLKFPDHIMRNFSSPEEAEAWLDTE